MIDVVVAAGVQPPAGSMSPEHRQVPGLREPMTVVDLASDIDLPVGVVRVLLSDLSQHGIIRVLATPKRVTNERLLRDVLDGYTVILHRAYDPVLPTTAKILIAGGSA